MGNTVTTVGPMLNWKTAGLLVSLLQTEAILAQMNASESVTGLPHPRDSKMKTSPHQNRNHLIDVGLFFHNIYSK